MGVFAKSVRLAGLIALLTLALAPAGSRADSTQREARPPAAIVPGAALPSVPAPTLIYPSGGESIIAGTTITITWNANSAPLTTTYDLEYTADCRTTPSFSDSVENGAGGWTVRHAGGGLDWTRVISQSHSPVTSWFASSQPIPNNQYLVSPDLVIGAGEHLFFAHQYNTEAGYDGGVVEISTDGVIWIDLGYVMMANGYNATIDPDTGSFLAGFPAFSGLSNGWLTTEADLSDYAGQTVKIRFLSADDTSGAATGWWVDDIEIRPPAVWTTIGSAPAGANSLTWTTPGDLGADYCVRIRGQAAGYEPSGYVSSAPFRLVGRPGTTVWLPLIKR
jgi:hypothetical protein